MSMCRVRVDYNCFVLSLWASTAMAFSSPSRSELMLLSPKLQWEMCDPVPEQQGLLSGHISILPTWAIHKQDHITGRPFKIRSQQCTAKSAMQLWGSPSSARGIFSFSIFLITSSGHVKAFKVRHRSDWCQHKPTLFNEIGHFVFLGSSLIAVGYSKAKYVATTPWKQVGSLWAALSSLMPQHNNGCSFLPGHKSCISDAFPKLSFLVPMCEWKGLVQFERSDAGALCSSFLIMSVDLASPVISEEPPFPHSPPPIPC